MRFSEFTEFLFNLGKTPLFSVETGIQTTQVKFKRNYLSVDIPFMLENDTVVTSNKNMKSVQFLISFKPRNI